MANARRFTPRLEGLDTRSLMSMTLTNGLLEVVGSTGNDVVRVTLPTPTQVRVTVDSTGEDQGFFLSAVSRFLIRTRGGDDNVSVDLAITRPVEVRAWAGNDTVLGGGGGDTILGGGGTDTLNGRAGNDTLTGEAGDDTLTGEAGDDTLTGDVPGSVTVVGKDTIDGGDGNDSIFGGPGDDTCRGGAGVNKIDGGPGNNVITGAAGMTNLSASFSGGGGATYTIDPGSGRRSFEVTVVNAQVGGTAVTATVRLNDTTVGEISLAATGNGSLRFASPPTGGAIAFPTDFPGLAVGSTVVVVGPGKRALTFALGTFGEV